MIKMEYLRFLQTLDTNDVSDDVRTMANLVLHNLDTLLPLSTAQGRRIKELVKLAQEHWGSLSSSIQPLDNQGTQQSCSIVRTKSMSVGPFRGFSKLEEFDLNSNIVLLYGPNGTGKSSFCEALEYSLLGNVAEADNRRFNDQKEYLKNAHVKGFSPPVLIGIDHQGKDVVIEANESRYRFCFLEKNRIDNFARIAAQAPARQTELISTLFGLDAFNEFVRDFTGSMDRYIDLEGVKGKELAQKRKGLAGFQLQLETLIPSELQSIGELESACAKEYDADYTFEKMVLELNGEEDKKGLIAELEDELIKPVDTKKNLSLAALQDLTQSIERDFQAFNTKQQELAKASQSVSFKRLYEAVVQVKESSSELCPACQTPLSQVAVNPYERASIELDRLKYLGDLQDEAGELKKSYQSELAKLGEVIKTCCDNSSKNNKLSEFIITNEKKATIDWWNDLNRVLDDGTRVMNHLELQVKHLEEGDKAIDSALEQRAIMQRELQRLRPFSDQMVKFQALREAKCKEAKQAKDVIEKFDTENAELISSVKIEKEHIVKNQRISDAYAIFIQRLNDYKQGLPAKLVADLCETVLELYNAFNRHYVDHEKLADVRLPLQQNQRLEIAFQNAPNTYFDALHVLSEGHIRCMGLAILAAKNIKEGSPFLIFDDPVNAIDDDHRESIRRTLFADSYFENKQIILACHGEEFFIDIQNLMSAEKAQQCKTFSFLPKVNCTDINVDHNCAPRNYLIAARSHYEKGEIRDALGKSRKALESLTKGEIWRYVRKHGDGNLSIKMRTANAPIELRNLTEQLESKVSKSNFISPNKDAVLVPLKHLLGTDGKSREWRYLNKGTHEDSDRAEFDRDTVGLIVSSLEQIDAALER